MEQVILEYFCGDDEWTDEQREALPEAILNAGLEYPEEHYLMPVSENELDIEQLLKVIKDWEQTVNSSVDWYSQGQSERAEFHLMRVLTPLNEMVKLNPEKHNATALISVKKSRLPRDARNDFIRKPTVLHLAILTIALNHHIDDETLTPLFEERLVSVIELGLSGGGRSPEDLLLWAIQLLSVAGTFTLIKERFAKEKYLKWIYKLTEHCKKIKTRDTDELEPMSVGYVNTNDKKLAAFGIDNLTQCMEPMSRLRFHHERLAGYEKSVQRSLLLQLISEEYKAKALDLAKGFVTENREQLLLSAEQHRPKHQVFSSKRHEFFLKPILASKITNFESQLSSLLEKIPVGRFYDIKQHDEETKAFLRHQDFIGMGCGFFDWQNLFENAPKHTKIYIRHVAMENNCSLGIYLQLVVS
jgi:hypothetical protein